jgi:hypothetical protein
MMTEIIIKVTLRIFFRIIVIKKKIIMILIAKKNYTLNKINS